MATVTSEQNPEAVSTTYVVVDGENIDATLGASILDGRPAPEQRPRWERLLDFAQRRYAQPTKGLFFLNASNGYLPMSFVQALLAMGYTPVPLQGEGKVVDIAIQRTADALRDRDADVMLVSHDSDFAPQMTALADGSRRVGIVGFAEFMASSLRAVPGVESFDLEYDVLAFKSRLPRVRIIPIDEFDPAQFL